MSITKEQLINGFNLSRKTAGNALAMHFHRVFGKE